ncbi:hypothetical protein Afil01_69320 [Actinorhabdospora filicis]|uniref:Uncharacterized protein n=1 Tax=Actinorhabdospora filicis TaxID=1785913 RepID=A0A9W6SUF9_9ACTN|nr:hypothetical protein [Actinorhabdospora filicis]GLZ82125.1 hypothetical protein Afil01_69320 [Actinorhabdospora filicis]
MSGRPVPLSPDWTAVDRAHRSETGGGCSCGRDGCSAGETARQMQRTAEEAALAHRNDVPGFCSVFAVRS